MADAPVNKTQALLKAIEGREGQDIGLLTASEMSGRGNKFEITFDYMGFLFALKAGREEQQTVMHIRANLGSIPYTIEGNNRRADALSVLALAHAYLGGRVHVRGGQRILLSEQFEINEPLTPTLMITKATTLIVLAKPYLELLSEVVNPPLAAKEAA